MKALKRRLAAVCAVLLVSVLTGCATKMSSEERAALKRISIGAIELPEKPLVLTDGTAGSFFIAGPLGVAIAQGTSDMPTAYKEHVAKHKIDLPSYVRRELVSQLKAKGIEVADGAGQGHPKLVVQVMQYGITGNIFSSEERWPQVWLRLSLVKDSGERMWLGYAAAHIDEGVMKTVERRPLADFFNDPALLEREVKKVTKLIVSAATKDL